MKAILMSVHAKWCALMMNGIKTVEVCKGTALYKATQKLIDENGYAEFYVYCTKDHSLIYTDGTDGKGDYVDYQYYESYKGDKNDIGSGKVIFKFRCYKVEDILFDITCTTNDLDKLYTNTNDENKLLEISCLTKKQISSYLKLYGCFPHLSSSNKGYYSNGFAIHISDLEIFDKPKELSEFHKMINIKKCDTRYCDDFYTCKKCDKSRLTKAPQSFCYIEVGE